MEQEETAWNWRQAELAETIDALREDLAPKLRERGLPAVAVEILLPLVAHAGRVERLALEADGKTGTLPGHMLSVLGYVEQVLLGGDAGALVGNLKSAEDLCASRMRRAETKWLETSGNVAEQISPSAIRKQASVPALFRVLGLAEIAYWREYEQRAWDMYGDRVSELADV